MRTNVQVLAAILPLVAMISAPAAKAAGDPHVVNADFGNVPIQCAGGIAYQSVDGGTCDSSAPQQAFNGAPGMGWTLSGTLDRPRTKKAEQTEPGRKNNPPNFAGLPFGQAALLQDIHDQVSQIIFGLV